MSSIAIKWARAQNFGSTALKSVVNIIATRADTEARHGPHRPPLLKTSE